MNEDLLRVLGLIERLFSKVFSEVRAFTVLKGSMFLAFLTFVGAGIYARANLKQSGGGFIEFLITEPNTPQLLVALAAFVLTLLANLYVMDKRRDYELRLRELEANSPKVLRRKLRPRS